MPGNPWSPGNPWGPGSPWQGERDKHNKSLCLWKQDLPCLPAVLLTPKAKLCPLFASECPGFVPPCAASEALSTELLLPLALPGHCCSAVHSCTSQTRACHVISWETATCTVPHESRQTAHDEKAMFSQPCLQPPEWAQRNGVCLSLTSH